MLHFRLPSVALVNFACVDKAKIMVGFLFSFMAEVDFTFANPFARFFSTEIGNKGNLIAKTINEWYQSELKGKRSFEKGSRVR